ncbi:uncharacterized protein LOC131553500 isoform X1 [Onychostoma macrolepis]|uniref:uncharacterized protein LOC131553500 isoform X1 n=1 Tax=Onychostoma macrolepis TaxID=369639 RepID=UPI00272CE3C2|nr:uncharacterized protein LOC131553500 isoform X1 [Onychostoma macrolepis]
MARRCVLGCGSPETLFPIPKIPWLRSRWLGFLHFEDGGISERSRLCSKHFTRECFKNWTQHEMGFVKYLSLTDTAVPSVYTVGSSQSLKPQTRDVACQCDAPYLKSVSLQTIKQKLKRRSKAIQVNPFGHSVGIYCSESVGTCLEPSCFTSTPIKRPQIEDTTINDSSTCTSKQLSDVTYEPDIAQEGSEKSVHTASTKHSGTASHSSEIHQLEICICRRQ